MPIFSNIFTTPEHAAEIDQLDYDYGSCIFNINIPYRFTSSIVSFWLPCTGMIIFYVLVMRRAIQIESVQSEMYNSIATFDSENKQQNSVEKKMWRREYKVSWPHFTRTLARSWYIIMVHFFKGPEDTRNCHWHFCPLLDILLLSTDLLLAGELHMYKRVRWESGAWGHPVLVWLL